MKNFSKVYLTLIVLLFAMSAARSQSTVKKYFDWDKPESIQRVKVDTTDRPADYLLDERAMEYLYGKEELEYYYFKHVIVQINTDKGLERFNKLYIGVDDVIDIITFKARSISPKGAVKEINEGQMKDQTDEEDGSKYKIFAFEGLEKGSIIEYILYSRNQYDLYGRVFFQTDLHVHKARFELYSPDNLKFQFKGYNGFPQMSDTTIGDKNEYVSSYFELPALFEEKYANYRANLCRVEYKLAYNTSKGKVAVFAFSEASKNIFQNLYEPDKKPAKGLDKVLNTLKVKDATTEIKARLIENYYKNNISVKTNQRVSDEVAEMLKSKLANPGGMTKLMLQTLELAGVKTELVVTTDRFRLKFDDDYESYGFLGDYLIYLPELKKFIAPSEFSYRLDVVPYEYAGNNGLFIRSIEAGGVKMGLGTVKKIAVPSLDDTYENITASIQFDLDDDKVNIDYRKEMKGYLESFYKVPYFVMDKENKDKLVDELLKGVSKDAKISDAKVSHFDMTTVEDRAPFTIEGKMEISELVERAGNRYLFKLGEVIGEQSEMYQEKKRQTDIEVQYPHKYVRIIKFKIPDGYEAQGLDKIKINTVLTNGDKKTAGFVSDYEIKDGWVIVTINEYYTDIFYSKSQYEEYRKVINAAADFNKVIVVLVKK